MLKTNEDRIVEFLVQCQPGQPRTKPMWRVGHEGDPFLLPGIGGITLNVQVGDPAFGLAGDHVEPGVSCTANQEKFLDFPNTAVQLYSCVGNRATIVSGAANRPFPTSPPATTAAPSTSSLTSPGPSWRR